MLKKAQVFFESYNEHVAESYEKFFRAYKNKDILRAKDDEIQEFIRPDLKVWKDRQIERMNGLTPEEFIAGVSGLEEAMELFKIGAKLCDRDLPEIFVDKLKSYGEESIKALLELALDNRILKSEEDFYISLMAIRILGKWNIKEVVDSFIQLIYQLDESQEILVEEIINVFENIGFRALDSILNTLENKEVIGYTEEYLLSGVVKIGKTNRDDRILKCLKSIFLRMEDRVLGALCLADYGDGRAIPVLRGFLEKNKGNINKETYNEVKAAIKRLGGSIDDL